MAIHAKVPLSNTILPDKEVWSVQLEGTYDDLKAYAASWVTGEPPPSGDSYVEAAQCTDVMAEAVVVQSQLVRKEGLLAELNIAYAYIRKVELWSCDMAEISKDIRTWLSSDAGGYTPQTAAPLLAQIAQWEAFKDDGDYIKWQNFVYDEEGHVLTGDALKVAMKIMKGVSCYSIYAPVLTRTTMWNEPPPLENAGCIDTPSTRSGWEILGEKTVDIDAGVMWLKTGCRSNPNGDGTYTLIEQWTGADEIDGDLYPTSGGGSPSSGTVGTGGTQS